jgi:hypothetical protein
MPRFRSDAPSVSLFTADEHLVFSDWFGVDHPDSGRPIGDILDEWHIADEIVFYRRTDAAVAQIVLEGIQDRLPTAWASSSGLTRTFSDRRAHRRVELWPTHLFTINWANSAPGLSWPVAYKATYIPGFDRTVVTASADSTDAFGVSDIAIGSFGPEVTILQGSHKIIVSDWSSQFASHNQQRWEYLEYTGLVSDAEAQAWADEAWPETREEDE